MVIRDAVVNDRLISLPLMDGFTHSEYVSLAYKESESALQYIADHYGEEKIASIFNKFRNQISISQILRETIGLGLVEFDHNFKSGSRKNIGARFHGRSPRSNTAHRSMSLRTPVCMIFPDPAGRRTDVIWPMWRIMIKRLKFYSKPQRGFSFCRYG